VTEPPDDEDNVTFLDVNKPRGRKKRGDRQNRANEAEKKARTVIPQLPPPDYDVRDLAITSDLTARDLACVNMRLMGAPFVEIARALEFASAAEAKRDFYRALAATHSPEDWETMRQVEVMRAEQLIARSFAMAAAPYFLDAETGDKIPNTDRLRWHDQAGKDLALHAMISGAKAPTRLEVTPTEAEYTQIVDVILAHEGFRPAIEADIIDVEEIPDAPADEP